MKEALEERREELIAELEGKNAEMERFTYTVSHDLKSPLITIRGFIGLLGKDMEKDDRERMEHDMERIDVAAKHMEELLNDLLDLSRIGRTVNPSEDVSLGDIASGAVRLLSGQIKEKGIAVEITPDLPTVFADRLRLGEVYQNLLENAVKYMGDQANPRIEIGMRREGEETVYYVRDNGIGIDPKYKEKVFGLFERLTSHAGDDGTGIGLAIVKRIIDLHEGSIWVESEGEGKGSTFCFTLPKSEEVMMSDGYQKGPFITLLIEDNRDHAELIRRAFEEYDVVNTVNRVADGEEAIDFLFRRREYADPRMTRHIQSWSGEPFSRGRQGSA